MYRFLPLAILFLSHQVSSDTNYRLNTPIRPSTYSITITPYFDTGDDRSFTFDGSVKIIFKTENTTNQIKIHSEDLSFNVSDVIVSNTNGTVLTLDSSSPLEFDANYSFAYINLLTVLAVGEEYTLSITYKGPIRRDLSGFYRNYYYENGVKKWLGATQLESTNARKVYPCFDEPDLKAKFNLAIDRPQTYKPCLANTRLMTSELQSNGYIRDTFAPTPVMSTYLVAFLISEFEGRVTENGTREFGVYSRPEALNQTAYAFDFGERVVKALGDYYGIDYYDVDDNLRLDHVALIDFRAGAMENWGLIKYRESLLLYVEGESSPYYKYRVAQIIAHETTHMWFGNLVTCHWWSNTWLNEGFANYFQDYITAMIEPEVASGNMLVTSSVYAAYDADDNPSSPPISNDNVNSPTEISGHFGTITYQKAGSVIRMMHHLIGDEAFKTGLHNYLNTNMFSAGYPNKMYEALEAGVASRNNSLSAYPGSTITEVMSSWITQPGHPVLDVSIDYSNDVITLNQKRFYLNASYNSNEVYMIPITYATKHNPDFSNTKPAFIMNNKTYEFTVANISENHSWIIFNVQETGFYRVNYDEHSWQIITRALLDEREQIHYLNRAKIVNDLFALYYADEIHFDRLYETLEFLKQETDFSVWYAAVRGLKKLWTSYIGDNAIEEIEELSLKLMDNIITSLGYDDKANEDFETVRNRMMILDLACKFGHQGCIDYVVNLYQKFRDEGTAISPSLRQVSYCNGLRFGNGSDYEFLWHRMSTTNVANEARTIGEVLGCSTDEDSLKRFLVSMTEEDSPIKFQDITVPLSGVLTNYSNLHIVMDGLKNNYTLWSTIYPSMETVVVTVASALHTEKDFAEFNMWLSECTTCTQQVKNSGLSALSGARASKAWADNHRDEILKTLGNHSSIVAPSLLLLFIVMVLQCFEF